MNGKFSTRTAHTNSSSSMIYGIIIIRGKLFPFCGSDFDNFIRKHASGMKSATIVLRGKVATNDCNKIENLHAGRTIKSNIGVDVYLQSLNC